MRPEMVFKGTFEVAPDRSLSPGNWYLGFACTACQKSFAVLDDPTGTGEIVVAGEGTFVARCPACGTKDTYPADRMSVFQSVSGGVTSPP